MGHFVYILQATDGRYYTGYTTDLNRRLTQHRNGTGAKFTRGFGCAALCYQEECVDKSAALQREAAIKKLTRAEKIILIERFDRHSASAKSRAC